MQTPLLILDKNKIAEKYNELDQALPGFRIAYAIKANPHREIIELLRGQGSHFEIASVYELDCLMNLGVDAQNIVFSNPVKKIESIEHALEADVAIQSFDSIGELEKYKAFKDKIKPIFRIHVPNNESIWPLSQKFGLSEKFWHDIFAYMQKHQIPLSGITFHVGSQCEALGPWHTALELSYKAIKMAQSYGLKPTILNIGGGFPIFLGRPIPSLQAIGEVISEHLQRWKADGYEPTDLIAEPGRVITGDAGTMYTQVIGVAERDEKTLVFTDVGIFGGLMEAIDGMTYPLTSNGSGPLRRVTLAGPSCDSLDTMFEADLPDPKYGDILTLKGTGAYSVVYASKFNGFPEPKIEFVGTISAQGKTA